MRDSLALLSALVCILTSCNQEKVIQPAKGKPAAYDRVELSQSLPELKGYENWTPLTNNPFPIEQNAYEFCGISKQRYEALQSRGLHSNYSIFVRANSTALKGLGKEGDLPTGSIFVKEKAMLNFQTKEVITMTAVTAMIKREKGYDPEGGDWEYLYYDMQNKKKTQGKLENCRNCHLKSTGQDYLYLTYLGEPKPKKMIIRTSGKE